ncbi:tyrosine-type recombinase/integrase [Aestuariicoccus sp. KMU-90]|uniref:Tyrosine-type recombinase/integrase n=1 Tax=Thetidibacter halocola TaxID=2827239 RepID=A0A8J8B716_9RHOB|nr:tyrosine-type recombinase/integrase [Thetidibacter halocola]
MAGAASDAELHDLVGHRIEHFRTIGNTTVHEGTQEWRSLAMALCVSEYEALARVIERDEGIFSGMPEHRLLKDATPTEDELPPVSLRGLFRDYLASRHALGKGYEAGKRWEPVIENLRTFVGHDDARKITKAELRDWRDALLKSRSARTVSNTYLASVRTIYNWTIREDRLTENPAENVRQEREKQVRIRPKGYSDEEALRILKASTAYAPAPFMGGNMREFPETTAAKRWLPLLCAMTGARVAEMAQLRKQDIRLEDSRYVLRISPEAGTVKTGQFRDVPLHRQIVELGFIDFVASSADGPLFYRAQNAKQSLHAARTVSDRVAKWLKAQKLVPEGVSPNHGWRHRFRTQAGETDVSDRIADAICGHAGKTAGDDYGDVTITAKSRLIDQLSSYKIGD